MRAVRILAVIATAAMTVLLGTGVANASEGSGRHGRFVCENATLGSGLYRHGVEVKGTCAIPDGGSVSILRGVVLDPGSRLSAITASRVHIVGPVRVDRGATLGLGCSRELTQPAYPGGPVICPAGVSKDRVDGSIIALRPRTLLIDNVTVYGNVVSLGGGVPVTGADSAGCEQRPGALNFAVKDNEIHGSVGVVGWRGCWLGYIRNVQHGSALFLANDTASFDSTEIVTNVVHGRLVCVRNTPAPQIGDSHGALNVATRGKSGQCRAV